MFGQGLNALRPERPKAGAIRRSAPGATPPFNNSLAWPPGPFAFGRGRIGRGDPCGLGRTLRSRSRAGQSATNPDGRRQPTSRKQQNYPQL